MKTKNKEIFNKKNTIKVVVSIVVIAIIAIGLYLKSSLATDTTTLNVANENHVELSCNDYISFENKLTCKVIVTVASEQEISSINLKLSDIPGTIENLLDNSYESTVLNEGNFVDIVFGNDIITEDNPISLDVINVTFDNVTEEKIVTTSDVFFLDSDYQIVNQNMKITNPTTASVLPVFSLEQGPMKDSNIIINDKYLFLGNGLSSEDVESFSEKVVENQMVIHGDVTAIGCNYKVSNNGTTLIITDNYGNNKILKVIYIGSLSNDYMLDWFSSGQIYTRGYVTTEEISSNLIKTNGFMSLTENEIQIYGDNEKTDLIDSRNWFYIKSDIFDFTNNIVNIPVMMPYDEFMSYIEFHGVTGVLYDSNGKEIKDGYLDKTNTLTISGISGWDTENITINTEVDDYVNINNINVLTKCLEHHNYIMYDISSNITIDNFLTNIDTNGIVKVYQSSGQLLTPINGSYGETTFISTNMYIQIFFTEHIYRYDISVLGDVVGKGTVYLSDIVKLYKTHRGKIEPTEAELLAGDVVKDGNIDLLDVAKLYRYYRGVEDSLK